MERSTRAQEIIKRLNPELAQMFAPTPKNYRDLQSFAKKFNIKANQKAKKLTDEIAEIKNLFFSNYLEKRKNSEISAFSGVRLPVNELNRLMNEPASAFKSEKFDYELLPTPLTADFSVLHIRKTNPGSYAVKGGGKIYEELTEFAINDNIVTEQKMQTQLEERLPRKFPFFVQANAQLYGNFESVDDRGQLITDDQQRFHYERRAAKIVNRTDRDAYIQNLYRRLLGSRSSIPENVTFQAVDVTITPSDLKKQNVIAVRKLQVGNCLLNVIKQTTDIGKVLQEFPDIAQAYETNQNIMVTPDQLDTIAKKCNIHLIVYSALGTKIEQPWQDFGRKKRTCVKVEFSDGHATLFNNTMSIKRIQYHPETDFTQESPQVFAENVVDRKLIARVAPLGLTSAQAPTTYSHYKTFDIFTDADDNVVKGLTMHKFFRPSTLTGNPADDADLSLAKITSDEQLISKIFREKYGLFRVKDQNIHEIVRSSEIFIGREMLKTPCADSTIHACDANRNYVSYRYNKYYRNFPTRDMYVARSDRVTPNTVFVNCTINSAPKSFLYLAKYKLGTSIVIPRPVYDYLLDAAGVEDSIKIHYTVEQIGPTLDIDIPAFGDELRLKYGKSESEMKLLCNSLIGRSIAGGVSETAKLTVTCNEIEKNQLIAEAIEGDFTFSVVPRGGNNCAGSLYPATQTYENIHELFDYLPQDEAKAAADAVIAGCNSTPSYIVTVDYKKSAKSGSGLFYFHSYILGYALTAVAQQWDLLEASGAEICGYCVDCLVYETAPTWSCPFTPSPTGFGKWKTTPISGGVEKLISLKPHARQEIYRESPSAESLASAFVCPDDVIFPYGDDKFVCIFGPAGSGKSHRAKNTRAYKQTMLAPTVQLVAEHLANPGTLESVMTVEKYFQLQQNYGVWMGYRNTAGFPQGFRHIIVDECFMFTRADWDEIRRRAAADNAVIIALGDPEQIRNAIESEPVTRSYFEEFAKIIDLPRGKFARQNTEEGELLDSLRGNCNIDTCIKTLWSVQNVDRIRTWDSNVICGTWIRCHYYNNLYRNFSTLSTVQCKRIRVEDENNTGARRKNNYSVRNIDDPLIWWGRKQMKVGKDEIGKCEWEPVFATTVDSYQGKTVDGMLYIDVGSMKRGGSLYTAITRTRKLSQMKFIWTGY
jgi:hypothetical protein